MTEVTVSKPASTELISKEQLKTYGMISSLSSSHAQLRELHILHTGVHVHSIKMEPPEKERQFLEPFKLLFAKIKI